jgi:hypothetical protein
VTLYGGFLGDWYQKTHESRIFTGVLAEAVSAFSAIQEVSQNIVVALKPA